MMENLNVKFVTWLFMDGDGITPTTESAENRSKRKIAWKKNYLQF